MNLFIRIYFIYAFFMLKIDNDKAYKVYRKISSSPKSSSQQKSWAFFRMAILLNEVDIRHQLELYKELKQVVIDDNELALLNNGYFLRAFTITIYNIAVDSEKSIDYDYMISEANKQFTRMWRIDTENPYNYFCLMYKFNALITYDQFEYLLDEYKQYVPFIEKRLGTHQKSNLEMFKAISLYELGESEDAISIFNKIAPNFSPNEELDCLYLMQIEIYMGKYFEECNRLEEAIKHFEKSKIYLDTLKTYDSKKINKYKSEIQEKISKLKSL